MSFFFSFLSFSFKLRERGGVYKIGYKEKQSQSYLSYLDGFLWRIFLLLRADRLYLIFSTGLKIRLLLVRDFLRLLLPGVLGFGSVRHEPCPTTNFLIIFFRWREEGATSVFRVPANHLASTFFLLWGCPRGVMVKAMDCGIVVREFVLQSRYYVHFRANTLGKGMNPLILPPAMDK